MAQLTIQEFDSSGALVATQSVRIGTTALPAQGTRTFFNGSGQRVPLGSGFPQTFASRSGIPPGDNGMSAPFHPTCVTLQLNPDPPAIAIITFGTSPTAREDGIVVPISGMRLAPQGAALAVF